MHRVILHGSCRADGRSAALADELFNACIEVPGGRGVHRVGVVHRGAAVYRRLR